MTTKQLDGEVRKKLLNVRGKSPMDNIYRLHLLQDDPSTALTPPRLLGDPLIFGGAATVRRLNLLSEFQHEEVDEDVGGAGTMITFMIIFYVGYCYDMYCKSFGLVQRVIAQYIPPRMSTSRSRLRRPCLGAISTSFTPRILRPVCCYERENFHQLWRGTNYWRGLEGGASLQHQSRCRRRKSMDDLFSMGP